MFIFKLKVYNKKAHKNWKIISRPRAAAVTAAHLLRSHNKAHSSQLVLQKGPSEGS